MQKASMASAGGILVLLVFAVTSAVPSPDDVNGCHGDKLTVYSMILRTFWTRGRFPKHYPDWRPPAQWSKVIGRSHDKTYTLFRLGEPVSPGVRAMAETSNGDVLEGQSQKGVLDAFSASPIYGGAGRAQAQFFVDSNHSLVSLMSRIVPSPDWFVGVDSFDLCIGGGWVDSMTIELDPIDAGTDNGFTFTAPDWPTEPPGVAYRITSRFPKHPAGSFYYPTLRRLPPIASVQFLKIKEYEVSEVFVPMGDSNEYEVMNLMSDGSAESDSEVELEMEAEQEEEERRLASISSTSGPNATASEVTTLPTAAVDAISTKSSLNNPTAAASFRLMARGDTAAIFSNMIRSENQSSSPTNGRRRYSVNGRRRERKKEQKLGGSQHCSVSEWGPWSPCSVSCGVGEMQRRRTVTQRSRSRQCPPLLETRWCGSACPKSHVVW